MSIAYKDATRRCGKCSKAYPIVGSEPGKSHRVYKWICAERAKPREQSSGKWPHRHRVRARRDRPPGQHRRLRQFADECDCEEINGHVTAAKLREPTPEGDASA